MKDHLPGNIHLATYLNEQIQKIERAKSNLKTANEKTDKLIDHVLTDMAKSNNSTLFHLSEAIHTLGENIDKYHLTQADILIKRGDIAGAKKHVAYANMLQWYDFSEHGINDYQQGELANSTLQDLYDYQASKLTLLNEASDNLKYLMWVHKRTLDHYDEIMTEEPVACRDYVLSIVRHSVLINLKKDMDSVLEKLNTFSAEKAQDLHETLTYVLDTEHRLIGKVSDYAFEKILPTIENYNYVLTPINDLIEYDNLTKRLPIHALSDLAINFNRVLERGEKSMEIKAKVRTLKESAIAEKAEYERDRETTLPNYISQCIYQANKFLNDSKFEHLLRELHETNNYQDKSPDFLAFNQLMCEVGNNDLSRLPDITQPDTILSPDIVVGRHKITKKGMNPEGFNDPTLTPLDL